MPLNSTRGAAGSRGFGAFSGEAPRGPADPLWSQVMMLVHADGDSGSTTFTDSSAKTTLTNSGCTVSGVNPRFGSGCLNKTTMATYLNAAYGSALGTGDFTIEFWVRMPSLPSTAIIYDQRVSGQSTSVNPVIYYRSNAFAVFIAGTDVLIGGAATANVWTSIAVTRQSGTLRLFVQGNLVSSASATQNFANNSAYFGSERVSTGSGLIGDLDELRVTAACRYTASYTPAVAPFSDY